MNPQVVDACVSFSEIAGRRTCIPFLRAEHCTEVVLNLTDQVATDERYDLLPILADALQDAGCDDEMLLNHCRYCSHHTPDCWVLSEIYAATEPEPPQIAKCNPVLSRFEVEWLIANDEQLPSFLTVVREALWNVGRLAALLLAVEFLILLLVFWMKGL